MSTHSLFQVYRFEVWFGGEAFGFMRVSGLKLSAAFEPLAVGGQNDGPVMLRVPVRDAGRLTFERGKYYAGQKLALRPGQALAEPMSIVVKNDADDVTLTYKISTPVLESVELSGLDASDHTVLVESLIVAHQGISEA